jgi:tetratricopeptide (TPR) repeat protein
VPPELVARRKEVSDKLDHGRALIKGGQLSQAVEVLQQAASLEDQVYGHRSSAKYELAKLFVRLGREADALDTYRKAYLWNQRAGDISSNGPPAIKIAMDYAILLARSGKQEEAKAIYYYGLRNMNGGSEPSRDLEPVPFLVVFDAEPEGIFWEYTLQRLEAAALMVKAMNTDSEQAELIARVRELAPSWFYLKIWKAAAAWKSPEAAQLLAQSEALASPGLERSLVERYRVELAEHRALNVVRDTPDAEDRRPMIEGVLRRSRMQCLRPNPVLLKTLSVSMPGQ